MVSYFRKNEGDDMGFKRARSKEQKDIRIQQIAKAAAKLYEKNDYEKITLAAIADELSFTRANLYKYIKSKEEIFLHIILSDLDALIAELERKLSSRSNVNIREFADIWTKALYKHKRLVELMSILYTVIEKNTTIEKLTVFKASLMGSLHKLFEIIKSALPTLDESAVSDFIYMQLYYVMGMYPATRQSEIQKKAIELAGFPYTPPDFVVEYNKFVVFSLNGLMKDRSNV